MVFSILLVPGGRLSEKFGAKRVLGASMAGIATLRLVTIISVQMSFSNRTYLHTYLLFHVSLILPLATKAADLDGTPWLVYIIRALMGVCEGT